MAQGSTGLSATPQIALVGCGYWGKTSVGIFMHWVHLPLLVDATENGQATARTLAPDSEITDSLDDVLRNIQIQGVALATPAETHAELAIQAMQAGKDVFVEKPMALTLEDAEKMKNVTEETGRILMVGHLLEYHPAVLKITGTDKLRRIGEDQLSLFKPS